MIEKYNYKQHREPPHSPKWTHTMDENYGIIKAAGRSRDGLSVTTTL